MIRDVILRDLELQDTVQRLVGDKGKLLRRRGYLKRASSPFSHAVQRAEAWLPPLWNKLTKLTGLSGRDLKAASMLLVLNYHPQLLGYSVEDLVDSETL
jgi:hypothetical protein